MLSRTLRDFIQVAFSQIISVGISIVRSLILPLYLGVVGFGYFQSYLFYISLLPIITLGYNDGIYVIYGNYDYDSLPKSIISSSNLLFIFLLAALSFIISFISYLTVSDPNLRFVIFMSCIYAVLLGINTLIMQILQVTRLFKEYSTYSITSRAISLLFILAIITTDRSYYAIIIADLVSFAIITIYIVIRHSDLFFPFYKYQLGILELKKCIFKGFPLLMAGLIGILYLGGGRMIVQIIGGLKEFSYYSFAISISSFVSIAITSASMVVYPTIARYDAEGKIRAYHLTNHYLKLSIIAIPILYYIAYFLVVKIYSEYESILSYLGIVFIMMYLQSFISILHNTFYKALSLEKALLKDNFYSILALFLIGSPLYYFTHSIVCIAIVTLAAFVTRYYISVVRLRKTLSKQIKSNITEVLYAIAFIGTTTSTVKQPYIGLLVIITLTAVYLTYRRKDIKSLKELFR